MHLPLVLDMIIWSGGPTTTEEDEVSHEHLDHTVIFDTYDVRELVELIRAHHYDVDLRVLINIHPAEAELLTVRVDGSYDTLLRLALAVNLDLALRPITPRP